MFTFSLTVVSLICLCAHGATISQHGTRQRLWLVCLTYRVVFTAHGGAGDIIIFWFNVADVLCSQSSAALVTSLAG